MFNLKDVLPQIFDLLLETLILPLKMIMVPVDLMLSQIPNIETIPNSISSLLHMIGSFPTLIVNITGINPVIWNASIFIMLSVMLIISTTSVIKLIFAMIRGT